MPVSDVTTDLVRLKEVWSTVLVERQVAKKRGITLQQ